MHHWLSLMDVWIIRIISYHARLYFEGVIVLGAQFGNYLRSCRPPNIILLSMTFRGRFLPSVREFPHDCLVRYFDLGYTVGGDVWVMLGWEWTKSWMRSGIRRIIPGWEEIAFHNFPASYPTKKGKLSMEQFYICILYTCVTASKYWHAR
jgi:hypothetical protein